MDPTRVGERLPALNREPDRPPSLLPGPEAEAEAEAEPIKRSPSVFADYIGKCRDMDDIDDVKEDGRKEGRTATKTMYYSPFSGTLLII